MTILAGVSTVFQHKKWIFGYVVIGLSHYALMCDKLDGATFGLIIATLAPSLMAASSFDKSKYRDVTA